VTHRIRRWLTGLLAGLALVAAVTGVIELLKTEVSVLSLYVLYLLAVLPVAVIWGVVLAVVTSVVSVMAFAFFFAPPIHSFRIANPQEAFALAVFVVGSMAVGELAARLRRQTLRSNHLAGEQAALRRVATLVAEGASPAQVFETVTREVGLLCGADLARMERYEADGTVTGVAGWRRVGDHLAVGTRIALEGMSIAAQVQQTGRPARVDSFTHASGPIAEEARALGIRSSVGCPIVVRGRVWGVIAASSRDEGSFPADTEAQIGEFTVLVATAISNAEARAELAASRLRIVAAADATRRRIERDLHDGTQQRLVSLVLRLRSTRALMPSTRGEVQGALSDVADGLADLVAELQEIARGIHPAILSRGGLEPALKTLARRSAVPVDLLVDAKERLPEPVEVAAYYVVSEALANAARHANASRARVEVAANDGALELSVQDDGAGGADPARGSGLVGLADRVEALGGTIEVVSPVGEGTTLLVTLPFSEE
jgi:signal transduction histidine kinase